MKFQPAILALFLQPATAIKCVPEYAARKAPCTIGDWGCNGGNLVMQCDTTGHWEVSDWCPKGTDCKCTGSQAPSCQPW
ncbi:uncharacterized protein B0J16DRAFT_351281 [Fusarium flagelliforme]|uniref:uncharacterized protein n=1 Tax=Fusarium flagelliforme TaxID=2675880 RepID=UPI001E8D1C19|nr:uncharacterized protein B0J16DRAFT_351281 [Fusarium flagelliforme]KAH7174055.1 hypothetical protein B0J16DRAFT_351281 [Fusarium flagelliforme]